MLNVHHVLSWQTMAPLPFSFALALVLVLLSTVLYAPSSTVPTTSPFPFHTSDGTKHRVLLLTAHPDDEAFFFGPTITALNRLDDLELYSLCLSVGDGDGVGEVRVEELGRSLGVLGVIEERRKVLDEE